MKSSTVIAVAAGFAVASAQLSSIPQCALSCAISSLGSTGCQETDIKCICSNSAFISGLIPCVTQACGGANSPDFQNTLTAAAALCKSAGVTLSIPVAGATTSAAASSSSSEAATTTTAVATTTLATTTSSVAVVVPTTTTAVVVVVPPATNTTTTAASNPTGTSNGTVSSSPLPSPTPTGNAAVRNTAAMGALGAVLAFAAALL